MRLPRRVKPLPTGDVIDDSKPYRVIEHPRAKHVHLKLSHLGELDVVVPKGYDSRKIRAVVAARQTWLRRARARQREQLRSLPDEYFERQPERVRLPALNETYTVIYKPTAGARVVYVEQGNTLKIAGPVGDLDGCARSLRTWLRAKAQQALPPWLRQTSLALGLPYQRTVIRDQRTRWGSCTARGVISLNCKLLFLTRPEVEYLFVHELCHTRHLNHSARYWALVERQLPDYRRCEAALRDAWRSIPRWAEE
ncbi:MAG: M48 family metallopeptidase [Gammaproteobacteria bacterium]|nr:M48 family metallopeptidase [Gammaproteobacteria bacterium]